MSSFSIKKLETTEPLNLYSDLNKSIEFGEGYATSTQEHDIYGKVYYLGGLEVYNLNTANLSEETIARFFNALESGNIYYAVFPDDQRKGRLPLVLNKKTRAFLETLPELLNNKEVKWYLYELPGDIDPDNNERRGSNFITDDNEKEIVLRYDEIEEHISSYGFVKKQESNDNIFTTEEDDNDTEENVNDSKGHDTNSFISEDKSENLGNNHSSDLEKDSSPVESTEQGEPQMDEFEKMMYEDEFKDERNDSEYEEDVSFDEVFAEPKDEPKKEEQRSTQAEETNDSPKETEDIDIANIDNQSSENSKDNIVESERTLISNRTKQFIQLPAVVEEIIDDISLPRFTDYPTNDVYNVTSNTMKKEIQDSNARIQDLESSIKHEARQLYRDYMYQSYISITRELDTENGNDNIKDAFNKYIDSKEQLDQEFDQELSDKKVELEEIFYGQRFEDYKAEVNAQIRKWYEDEYYKKDVIEPLDDYKQKRQIDYDNRKVDKTSDFNQWLKMVEDTAIGQDQQEAIQKIAEFIKQERNKSMANIDSLQRRMDQVNQSLSQIEYQERANENIRKNFGTDLEQDEQAKIYKHKLDKALEDKAQLDADLKKFEAETKQKKKEIDETHKKELEKLNKDHSELIKQLKNEKETLEKDNRKKEEQAATAKKESDSNAKKTGVKFAGIATLATAIVIGGCSMVTNHSKESDNNHKIEQQQKELKSTNKKLDSQEKQLKDKDSEIKKQKDKVKKAQEQAKKSSDKKSKKK